MSAKIVKSDAEWRKQLGDEAFEVTRHKATERAFSGRYHDCRDGGIYRCVCCGAELFSSSHKFDSGSGWPSYWQALAPESVKTAADYSHFMHRTEALCASCDAHLGHVFEDGPEPTGLRYCINSAALKLEKK